MYNELQLLSPHMDSEVNKVLEAIGVDIEFPVEYFPAVHRDLSGKVALGFLARGDVNINRKHLTGPCGDIETLIIASAYTDTSLTESLCELSVKSPDYSALVDAGVIPQYPEMFLTMPSSALEENWHDVEKQIEELIKVRDQIRGPAYNSSGSLKMPCEFEVDFVGQH